MTNQSARRTSWCYMGLQGIPRSAVLFAVDRDIWVAVKGFWCVLLGPAGAICFQRDLNIWWCSLLKIHRHDNDPTTAAPLREQRTPTLINVDSNASTKIWDTASSTRVERFRRPGPDSGNHQHGELQIIWPCAEEGASALSSQAPWWKLAHEPGKNTLCLRWRMEFSVCCSGRASATLRQIIPHRGNGFNVGFCSKSLAIVTSKSSYPGSDRTRPNPSTKPYAVSHFFIYLLLVGPPDDARNSDSTCWPCAHFRKFEATMSDDDCWQMVSDDAEQYTPSAWSCARAHTAVVGVAIIPSTHLNWK